MRSFLSLIILLTCIPSAHAYNCMRMELNPLQNLSGLIFEGTVIKITSYGHKKISNDENRAKIQFVTFQIDQLWNDSHSYLVDGNTKVEIMEPLQGGGGCPYGFGFKENEKYLVFTQKNGALLQARAHSCTCAKSALLNSNLAQQDLNTIKKIKEKSEGAQ